MLAQPPAETRLWRHFDPWLFLGTLALVIWGIVMVYSATVDPVTGAVDTRVYKQVVFALVGLGFFFLMVTLDYRALGPLAAVLYLLALGLLVVVLLSGRFSYGAQRWLSLGPIEFQPSEPAKLFVIVALARFFSRHRPRLHRFRWVLASLALAALPAGLTFLQPDLGTAMVYLAIWGGMVLVAGLRGRHLLYLLGAALAVAPFLWLGLRDYMRRRLLIFLDPYSDPFGAGYNIIQAMLAVGSGGLVGRGLVASSDSQLRSLIVQYADFIFAILAEEFGFLGGLGLFALYGLVLWRCLRAAFLTSDLFGRFLAVGVATALCFQAQVHIGMNLAVLPVTGLPLPLVSYGGSALLTFLSALGLVESVAMRHRKFEF